MPIRYEFPGGHYWLIETPDEQVARRGWARFSVAGASQRAKARLDEIGELHGLVRVGEPEIESWDYGLHPGVSGRFYPATDLGGVP